jgi:hypothetical protein
MPQVYIVLTIFAWQSSVQFDLSYLFGATMAASQKPAFFPNPAQVAAVLQGIPADTLADLAAEAGVTQPGVALMLAGDATMALGDVARLIPAVIAFRGAHDMPMNFRPACPCCGRAHEVM